jgi:NAD(P)-dependent dehydrogenase (short-subunit alcohol dehydrogenase family)
MGTDSDRPVAMVTGAGSPVGRAVADRLMLEGLAVAGVDARSPCGDLPLTVDATDRAAVKAAAARVISELGVISVLVTTCDIYDAAPIGQMSFERWDGLVRGHLAGTCNAVSAVVPDMLAAGKGSVITTSSWLALAGIPGEAYYAAATGTILAFTKSLAVEVASQGVHVNCIAVGPMEREKGAPLIHALDDTGDARDIETLRGVTDTVVFLISEGGFYIGQVFEPVCGAVV